MKKVALPKPLLLKTKSTSYSMSEIDFLIIQNMRSLRNKKGWTQDEWTFLLGHENQYATDLEDFTIDKKYSLDQLDYATELLDSEMSKIVPNYSYDEDIIINASKRIFETYISYSATVVYKDQTRNIKLNFREKIVVIGRYKLKDEYKDFVLSLIKCKYFDSEKNTVEIFKKFKKNFGADLRPLDIQKSLSIFTRKGKSLLLEKVKNKSGRISFQKISMRNSH